MNAFLVSRVIRFLEDSSAVAARDERCVLSFGSRNNFVEKSYCKGHSNRDGARSVSLLSPIASERIGARMRSSLLRACPPPLSSVSFVPPRCSDESLAFLSHLFLVRRLAGTLSFLLRCSVFLKACVFFIIFFLFAHVRRHGPWKCIR